MAVGGQPGRVGAVPQPLLGLLVVPAQGPCLSKGGQRGRFCPAWGVSGLVRLAWAAAVPGRVAGEWGQEQYRRGGWGPGGAGEPARRPRAPAARTPAPPPPP